jgi:hypothetical protein
LPDLVDFCVTKDIPQDFTVAKSCFDLSSDHSPFLITLTAHALNQKKQPSLRNRQTYWNDFRHLINEKLTLHAPLKPKETFKQQSSSTVIQNSTMGRLECNDRTYRDTYGIQLPILIKQKIEEKKKTP